MSELLGSIFEMFTESLAFLLEPWRPIIAALYYYSPLVVFLWILVRYQNKTTKKRTLSFKEDREKYKIKKESTLDDVLPQDLMSFADIQILLGLQRTATTQRIKEAGLASWKFGGKGNPMYLRKEVMKAFKKEEQND